jgi:ribosomal protein L40E
MERNGMPGLTYLAIMLGVIAIVAIVAAPSLFHKKCQKCGTRNSLDARACSTCGDAFPEDA